MLRSRRRRSVTAGSRRIRSQFWFQRLQTQRERWAASGRSRPQESSLFTMPLRLQPIEPSSSSLSADPELELHRIPAELVGEIWDIALPFVREAIPRAAGGV